MLPRDIDFVRDISKNTVHKGDDDDDDNNNNNNNLKVGSSKGLLLAHIIKKDRFKMAAVFGLSTSRSDYFVRKDCI